MDDEAWNEYRVTLASAAAMFTVLANCMGVVEHLDKWRSTADGLQGMLAADGLDQARGDLERLASGGAEGLLATVDTLLELLPTPLE